MPALAHVPARLVRARRDDPSPHDRPGVRGIANVPTAGLPGFGTGARRRVVYPLAGGLRDRAGSPAEVDGMSAARVDLQDHVEGRVPRENQQVARCFDEVATLLEEQGANPYRVASYRRAAAMLRGLSRPIGDVLRKGGLPALDALPTIGDTLARAIQRILVSGHLPMLDRLRGTSDPERVLVSVPGVGRVTARHLHELGVETLEDLETAASDGRLQALAGIGPKRLAGIRDSLAQRLGRVRNQSKDPRTLPARGARGPAEPDVAELLDVDREYRERAAAGELRRIAPRRFNPAHRSWLPILHTQRGTRHYTALFSNTAHAHQAGKTGDWVVLYADGDGHERQHTVITAEHGTLRGRRIVRGREDDCARLYGIDTSGGAPAALTRPRAAAAAGALPGSRSGSPR
jgi:hypothetical protein